MEMRNVTLADAFTQEELHHLNIHEPIICPDHHKSVKLVQKAGLFELDVCCCHKLAALVRSQITEEMANQTNRQ